MNSFVTISPTKYYVINREVCVLKTAQVSLTVAANQVVVAAVTGKIHRLMGMCAQSNTATVGSFTLSSNSGGTRIWAPTSVPPTTNGDTFQLPIVDAGYTEVTTAGHGIYASVAGGAINMNLFYITYTPSS